MTWHPRDGFGRARRSLVLGCLGALTMVAGGDPVGGPAPRSDGCRLHVGFEAYHDGLVGPLNAGVVTLGFDPFARPDQAAVRILRDPSAAFDGTRCGEVRRPPDGRADGLRLQPRCDAPGIAGDTVAETVFRPAASGALDLVRFPVWTARTAETRPAGVSVFADGAAADGTYDLTVEDAAGDHPGVASGHAQSAWLRLVLRRRSAEAAVDVWAGPPGAERFAGRFRDIAPAVPIAHVILGGAGHGAGCWDTVRVGGELPAGAAVAPEETNRAVGAEDAPLPSPLELGREKQLLLDDALVESAEGLRRVFGAAVKSPRNPLLPRTRPWEAGAKYWLPMTVLERRPAGPLRLWYAVYGRGRGKNVYTCLADSDDGLQWTLPDLGLTDFQGSRANNIVREGRAFRVLGDPQDPDPARRYKAIAKEGGGFLALFSPDGLRWKATPPVLTQAYDATAVYRDPVASRWIASCKIFLDGKRARGYAESRDFLAWSDTVLMLAADARDPAADQLYSLAIFRYESLYLGLLKVYHTDTDRCDLQLAFSRHARRWERPHRAAFLSNGAQPADWDFGNLDDVGAPVRRGNALWFYYGGRQARHEEARAETQGNLGLATLRLDGFAALEPTGDDGVLITRPVILKGATLCLNADARDGEIRVELLEERRVSRALDNPDQPIYPFLLNACRPITGDRVRHAVHWESAKDFAPLDGRPVRLRIYLKRAALYAFWIE